MGKVFPGQQWRPPRADQQNGWDDVAEFYNLKARRRDNPRKSTPIPTDLITLVNDSGDGLPQGHVLEIGVKLITTPTRNALWFDGNTPTGTDRGIAIALRPMPDEAIDWCQVSGVCLAQVDIVNTDHEWADVVAGSTLLKSSSHGRVKIIQQLLSGTGTRDCLVRIGTGRDVPRWQTFNWDLFTLSTGVNYKTVAGVENPTTSDWVHPGWQIISNKITCQESGWYRFDFEAWAIWNSGNWGVAGETVYGYVANTTSATPPGPTNDHIWIARTYPSTTWGDSTRVSWCELRNCTAGEWLTLVIDITGVVPTLRDARITIGERIRWRDGSLY